MPGCVRRGDISRGHDGFPPRPNIESSSDVIVNNRGAVRIGDKWAVHCNSHPRCHDGNTATASNTVFVNNKQVMRIGDSISCGDHSAQGSSDVIIGD